VRVRFPSPAPHAKRVAVLEDWTQFPKFVSAHNHQKSALVPLPRAINHAGECPGDCQFQSFLVDAPGSRCQSPTGCAVRDTCFVEIGAQGHYVGRLNPLLEQIIDKSAYHGSQAPIGQRFTIPRDRYMARVLQCAIPNLQDQRAPCDAPVPVAMCSSTLTWEMTRSPCALWLVDSKGNAN
jgi:hypothetical protein